MSTTIPPVQTSLDEYLRKSWFHRNWKWFVPTLIVMGFVCFGLTIFSLVEYSFRHSGPFEMAMERATHNSKVVDALGPTIKTGFFVAGSIQTSGSSGRAELSIPVSGEHGKGTVYIAANKRGLRWFPLELTFENAANGERTDLLAESVPAVEAQ